jgi:hypothetical protein
MYDIIVIDKETFLASTINTIDNNKYRLKLEELFKTNECFINTTYKFSTSKGNGWNSSRPITDNKDGIRKKLFASDVPLKPIDKILKSIKTFINILNKGNQLVIESKIRKIMLNTSEEEQECILRSFVHMCILHSPYLETFIDIMKNVFTVENIESYGCKLRESFVADLPQFMCALYTLEYSNYDDFCMFNKKKELLQNKLYIIMHMSDDDIKISFSDKIIDILCNYIESDKINICDFVIDYMIYIFKLINNFRVMEVLDCKYNMLSIKSRFRIEDFRKQQKEGLHFI